MVCAKDGPTISVAAGVGLVMVILRSELRCKVVITELLLFPGTRSMMVAEVMLAESCLVLSDAAVFDNAAFGKLPVMVRVPFPAAPAFNVSPLQELELEHPARLPAPTAVDTTNPAGFEFAIETFVASFGPRFATVSVYVIGALTFTVAADWPTVMLKSDVRCKVVPTLLELLPVFVSTTEVEPIVAESCLVLSCATPAAKAALGKLPVTVNVPLPPAPAVSVRPVHVVGLPHAAKLPAPIAVLTANPAGTVFEIATLVASFGPALDTVSV